MRVNGWMDGWVGNRCATPSRCPGSASVWTRKRFTKLTKPSYVMRAMATWYRKRTVAISVAAWQMLPRPFRTLGILPGLDQTIHLTQLLRCIR